MANEDDDPVGCPPRDPVAEFRGAAESCGLIRSGDPIELNPIDFGHQIVERCASLAIPYGDDERSAAEAIRPELGAH